MATLFNLTSEMQNIEDALVENGGELTPEIQSALTFTQTELMQKVDNISALINKFKATQEACKAEKSRIASLQKTAENAEKRLKEMVLYNMGTFGIDKMDGNLCKFSKRKSEVVDVNEDMLLAGYQYQIDELRKSLPSWCSVEVKVNKTELKKAIKQDGVLPEGAEIIENNSLIIK